MVPQINKSQACAFYDHINRSFNQSFKNLPTFPFTVFAGRRADLSSTGPWTSAWPWWGWRCGAIRINAPSPRILSPPCTSSWTGGKSSCCRRELTTTLSSSGGNVPARGACWCHSSEQFPLQKCSSAGQLLVCLRWLLMVRQLSGCRASRSPCSHTEVPGFTLLYSQYNMKTLVDSY